MHPNFKPYNIVCATCGSKLGDRFFYDQALYRYFCPDKTCRHECEFIMQGFSRGALTPSEPPAPPKVPWRKKIKWVLSFSPRRRKVRLSVFAAAPA